MWPVSPITTTPTFRGMESGFQRALDRVELSNISLWASCLLIVCLLTFWWRTIECNVVDNNAKPPLYRAAGIPLLGNAFSMMWDTRGTLDKLAATCYNLPTRLHLLVVEFYVFSGPEAIAAVWKERDLHVRAYNALSVANMFAMPKKTLNFWMAEDSGINPTPHSDSKTPVHERIHYFIYQSAHRFLVGPPLKHFARRFCTNMLSQQTTLELSVTNDWMDLDDLWALVREKYLNAAVEAMYGEYLTKLNPTLVKDYWDFNEALFWLAKGYPRWMNPHPYRIRDKCINSMKKWHEFIRPYLMDEEIAKQVWNPYYGTDIIRFRHLSWWKMEAFDENAAATEDLAMLWAANANSVIAAFWMLAEVLHRPYLYNLVKQQIQPYRQHSSTLNPDFDFEEMCTNPLLQAIYAETMRLRVAAFLMRSPERKDFKFGKWTVPEDSIMLVSGYQAQMDQKVWDPNGDRPVEGFWPERYLWHADGRGVESIQSLSPAELEGVTYSNDGRGASWLPYGGGNHMCPGRHFAKQELISSTAVMITLFDIELLDERLPGNDMRGFGFGSLLPDSKLRARIRRANLETL